MPGIDRHRISIVAGRGGNTRLRVALLHYGFALTGAATALLGPILPALSAYEHFSDVEAGRLFSAEFLGSFTAAVSSSRIFARFGIGRAATVAFLAVAVGFLTCMFAPARLLLLPVGIYGAGLGLAIPAITLAVAALSSGRSAPGLNLLNGAWCAGAIVVAPIATALISHFTVKSVFLFFAIAGLLAAVGTWLSTDDATRAQSGTPANSSSHAYAGLAALTGGLLFLYVGTETSFAGWCPSWAGRLETSGRASALASPCFWAGILVARLVAPVILKVLLPSMTILIGLAISATAAVLMLAINSPLWIAAGAGIAGFGFGAVFPTAVAIFCDAAGDSAPHFANIIFASGALGGATIPLAVGWTVSKSGDHRAGLAFAACSICTMIALEIAIRRHLETPFSIRRREPDAWLRKNHSKP